MKSTIAKNILAAIALITALDCQSQGFLNLNFESANVSGYSPGYGGVPTEDAFPYWSAYFGPPGNPTQGSTSTVFYDDLSGGGAFIAVQDSNAPAPYGPIQGNYSALLEGSLPAEDYTASLGQTGTIPSTAQSLIFWDSLGEVQVSFDGQTLSVVTISNTTNYTVYGVNISAYAGQTGQLLFTAPVYTATVLDNIQFSTSPVPEPGTLALCALGGLSLALRARKKSSA